MGASSSSASRAMSTRSSSRVPPRDHDAEDVFQDVFAKAYEHLGRLRDDTRSGPGSRSSPAAPASTGCGRLASSVTPRSSTWEVDETLERSSTRRCRPRGARRALGRLPRDPRPLLRPRRELPHDRRRARAPAGTIAGRISRCLDELRDEFEEETGRSFCVWMNGDRGATGEIERLAQLLRSLPPAPATLGAGCTGAADRPWPGFDEIVARAEADEAFRQSLVADLEARSRRRGLRLQPDTLEALRRRLSLS